jgi:hypothetical protein
MRPHPKGRVLGLLVGVMLLGAGVVLRAGEPPSDKLLAEHGLKRAGPYLVLEAESDVHTKTEALLQRTRDLSRAVAVQRSTTSQKDYNNTINEWNNYLRQLRAQSNMVQQNINRMPKNQGYSMYPGQYRGGYGGFGGYGGYGGYSMYAAQAQYQNLNVIQAQLQAEMNNVQATLNQLKSKPFDPRDKLNAEKDVRNKKDALQKAVQELRKLVDGVRAKYPEVAKDSQVKKWLNTPEGRAAVKPKLGPSRAFLGDEKTLEQAERQVAGNDEPASKSTKKGRRTTKSKRPAASEDSASPF